MDLLSYVVSCRCCYGKVDRESSAIDGIIEEYFKSLTDIELVTASSLLSNKICQDCILKLESFYYFKQDLIANQVKLYKLLAEQKALVCDEIDSIEYDDENIKLDPEVKIESEFDLYKDNDEFEQIDYDVQAVAQLNFDQPTEAPFNFIVRKKRRRKDPFRNASFAPPDSKSHACNLCQKFFSDKKKVKLHIQRVHKQIKDHKCDECEYRAHTKWDILRHIKTNHKPQDTSDPKDSRICPDCGKVLKGNNHLNFHIKTKHLKLTKYSCDKCDFKSYGKYEIRSHIEIHHLPLEFRKGFPCDLCSSVLTTSMSLKTHKTHKHSGLRPHTCFCGKSYALRETLKSHIRNVHNGERKYKCPHCDKGFNSNPRLNDHVNNNHGEKQKIPCEKCNKVFNSIRNLQTHMVYHTTPTLKCSYCEKLFFIRKNLREHQESVHLGITYSCELCNRSFQSTSGLRRHSKSHFKS